jgi:L-asparaginase
MRFFIFAISALTAVSSAAPAASPPKVRQAKTASERLGLTWLGGNSSLPKILYVDIMNTLREILLVVTYEGR